MLLACEVGNSPPRCPWGPAVRPSKIISCPSCVLHRRAAAFASLAAQPPAVPEPSGAGAALCASALMWAPVAAEGRVPAWRPVPYSAQRGFWSGPMFSVKMLELYV